MNKSIEVKLARCLSEDNLKSYLFNKAVGFAKGNSHTIDWDNTEHGDFGRHYFEEFLEYIEDDRPEQVNVLIEKELEFESSLSSEDELDTYLDAIITQDEYHIQNIITFRDLIF